MLNLTTNNYADDSKILAYQRISQERAKEIIDNEKDYIILDVRTKEEYDLGHIKGAINFPNEDIGFEELPFDDKDKMILVYCRSGHRSLQASSKLAILGFKNIYEFGGIITWEYEIEK